MKKILNSKSTILILIIIGLIVTVLSFTLKIDNSTTNNIIIILDILLLLINIFYLSYKGSENFFKSIFNSFSFSIIYLLFFTGLGLMASHREASLIMMLDILKILIYLGPSIIILLPIIYIILQA